MPRFLLLAFACALAACSWPAPKPLRLEPLATLAAGLGGEFAGGEAGPPSAVVADGKSIFLGWRGALTGHEVVACDPDGHALWGHHHGPEVSGVRSLAAVDGVLIVLADAEGSKLYRLDAATGAPLPWEGRTERDLPIASLWGESKPEEGKAKIDRADWVTGHNGRIYITFRKEQFIAALDAKSGSYVATLTGPEPGQMAFSTTPMRDPVTKEERPIDFGIASIAGNGLAYFLMEHEPPWVMASTTTWLQEDERITALACRGDAMKSAELTLYTALAPPLRQVQLRPVDAPETYVTSVGKAGGRKGAGPWIPEALGQVRALAVDAAGQLWVAEGDESFGRFTVWSTAGAKGALLREILGPLEGRGARVEQAEPLEVTTGALRWRLQGGTAKCIELLEKPTPPTAHEHEVRDEAGWVLWAPPQSERSRWSVHRASDGQIYALRGGKGVEVFALRQP